MNSCSWKGNLQPEVSALDQEITEGDSDMMEMLKLLVFGICPACRSLSYSWDEFQNTAWSHLCLSAVTFPINLIQQQQKYPPKTANPEISICDLVSYLIHSVSHLGWKKRMRENFYSFQNLGNWSNKGWKTGETIYTIILSLSCQYQAWISGVLCQIPSLSLLPK